MKVNMIDKKRGLVGSRSHYAIEADLDQLLFVLDADQHEAFVRILDNPPPPNAVLKELLTRKSLWERI
jgi:uncharacterized protein (DUF1778 family)